MSKLLVLGVGPLPIDSRETRLFAPGLRTWHIAQILARKGHRVALGVVEFGTFQEQQGEGAIAELQQAQDGISLYRLRFSLKQIPQALSGLHRAAGFDGIVSTTDIMNYFAAMTPERIPLWLDYNGDAFAEKQLQAAIHGSDAALLEQWRYLAPALAAGDRFSSCSKAQKYSLIGQLGMIGRLNARTSGEELVEVLVPCSTAIRDLENSNPIRLRGRSLPADALVVLWTGGYNTWTDPDVLFAALEKAIRTNPRIHYVSTGGAIEGHDSLTFRRFKSLVAGSDLRANFHFVGWIPTDQVRSYYTQADLALNVDAWSYECELGYRNRITDWIQHGCPVATTTVCEFARDLAARGLVYGFDPADADALSATIVSALASPEERQERAARAKAFFDEEMRDEVLYAPLLRWAAAPRFAGDREALSASSASPLPGPVFPSPPSALAAHHKMLFELLHSKAWSGSQSQAPFLVGAAKKLMGALKKGIIRGREKL